MKFGILIFSFQRLEFSRYFYEHWNSDLIQVRNTGILIFLFINFRVVMLSVLTLELWLFYIYTWEFCSYPSKQINSSPIFLEFWLYPYKTLELLCYATKHWNSCPVFIHIGFQILSFQTVEFWPYFYKHWNYYLILPNVGILTLFL